MIYELRVMSFGLCVMSCGKYYLIMSEKKSYKDLEIYTASLELFFGIHSLSLQLPRHELYELGSQLRRSSDSIVSNIVEGYGRRRYKADFIRFLVFSHSSCLETINHIHKISILYHDLKPNFEPYFEKYELLGGKIFNFIKYIEQNWNETNPQHTTQNKNNR